MVKKISLEDVDVMLVDQDRTVRSTIRNILSDNGFRNIDVGTTIDDILERFKIGMPDLLICDHETTGTSINFPTFVYKIRHNDIGNNPFLPIIAMAWSPNQDEVKRIIQAGADDLVTKPLSAGGLMQRIEHLIKARKPFIVTSAYIGPDRRKKNDPRPSTLQTIDVPNTLKAKAIGDSAELNSLQRAIDASIAEVNVQKLSRHGVQMRFLVDRIVPGLAFGPPDEETQRSLERLLYVAQDAARRLVGTRFAHVSELCHSLIDVTKTIADPSTIPEPKDVKLLKPLAQAIQAGFDESGAQASATAREIKKTIKK